MRSVTAFLAVSGFFVLLNAVGAAVVLVLGSLAKALVEDAGALAALWILIGLIGAAAAVMAGMSTLRFIDAASRRAPARAPD